MILKPVNDFCIETHSPTSSNIMEGMEGVFLLLSFFLIIKFWLKSHLYAIIN